MGLDLPIDGIYDQADYNAVKQFQLLMKDKVLAPWVEVGCLPNVDTPTGYVYRTTKWTINSFFCPELKPDVSDEACYGGIGNVVGMAEEEAKVLSETTTNETIPGETQTTETTLTEEAPTSEVTVAKSVSWIWYLLGVIGLSGILYFVFRKKQK